VFAELGTVLPRAGGQYAFFREAFHPLLGFLHGWSLLLIIQSGATGAVAVACGEYAALVATGALAFADALPLVRFLAQAMQEAVPAGTGAMAAVMGLDDAVLAAVCVEAAQGQVVEPVNFNAPAQIVIAGHREAVERAIALSHDRYCSATIMLAKTAAITTSFELVEAGAAQT
jgi:amino acid transporter